MPNNQTILCRIVVELYHFQPQSNLIILYMYDGLYTQFKMFYLKYPCLWNLLWNDYLYKLFSNYRSSKYIKLLLKYMQLHSFLNEGRTLDDSVSNYKGKWQRMLTHLIWSIGWIHICILWGMLLQWYKT